ncbi:hypothetical protein OIE62_14470 [Streptomyces scopuliridis]|uniref:Uncharacterized protein n=1 Tax=Streptomyces scopuliridis TaxID=452529 RepID=A0ACD4ZP59_9ACTN|nr:hypothetical protein [Streptomyces scopuliridis]WSB35978.1 hypothetical protein OG949_26115 [Streptomyces scopuliridis]WSC00278.1 hypothetical protein OG835_26925 [Streptomyces scopuliridis]WSC06111.1 hypothetical protein OIE62_14470 [Streptomyces scopuliridis]
MSRSHRTGVALHGAIVEQGTHDELPASEGAYARLYASQFAVLAV